MKFVAGSIENQEDKIWNLIKICPSCEIKAYNRRSYLSPCINNHPTELLNWEDMRNLTEENFKYLGCNDRNMHNWLMIIKNIQPVTRDIKLNEKQLPSWKDGH